MGYAAMERRLAAGGVAILDGGTGTELQRRGVSMDPHAWCGPASLESAEVLEAIHRDYIAAGAEVITANTYASSRLMLEPAGFGDRFAEINRTAVAAARRARDAAGRPDVLVAGSLSHMAPMVAGSARADRHRLPPPDVMADALAELAHLLREAGCDLIALEMMYDPERIPLALAAAADAGLPLWAGFSARRAEDGRILGFDPDRDIPFADLAALLDGHAIAAAGLMHTPADAIVDALAILRRSYTGPLLAYPDSGYFKMPEWQFEDVIAPETLARFAAAWVADGAQIVGGCCGLTPAHIAALAPLGRGGG